MYSVEDLLVSHGYKPPQNTASTPTPTPDPAPVPARQAPSPSPPSYSHRQGDGHHEILEKQSGQRTVNGYEREAGGPHGGCGRLPPDRAAYSSNNNSQPRWEADSRSHGDTHSLGESLTSDSGIYDGPRGVYSSQGRPPRDVSFWRRKGQDFSVLLDYTDLRDPRGRGGVGAGRIEVAPPPRGQEGSAEEQQRERQRWAAQSQAHAKAQARSREREAALHQWRMAAERKCQSLGTEEWRPVVSFGRQLSDCEGERWAQEKLQLHGRTPEGAVAPRTKAKSQSLPRVLPPDGLHQADVSSPGQELYRRVNGHPSSPRPPFTCAPRWPENGRPASASQISTTPKARFTRPPRPPSYEMHQQSRGSCEMLSGSEPVGLQARDRTPLPFSRSADPRLDYYAQEPGSEPPGYNPPPSYKRAPIMRGGYRGYGEVPVNYRFRGDVYHQMQMAPDGFHWFSRHAGGSWPDPRSVPSWKQLYSGYGTQERPGTAVQYIPFTDPRIRHISSGLGGNSLTDADKIRHIRNELPSVTVSEPCSDDSAFLPPSLGPHTTPASTDPRHTSPGDFENTKWHSDLHKETDPNFPATDQNCNHRYPKNLVPPRPPSAYQALEVTAPSASRQSSGSDPRFSETITQVKKIVPDSGSEGSRNNRRRVSETIFCLVSVPINAQANRNKEPGSDQNNNETAPSPSGSRADAHITAGLRSKSMTDMAVKLQLSNLHSCSSYSIRNSKRAPLRKEIVDAWALQAIEDKELCYAGSWPGDQYRNQETQTSSPVKVAKDPGSPPSPVRVQEPGQSLTDTTADSGLGADCSASYGYPLAGQKNLHPSSNSAFSRLSLSPAQPLALPPPQPPSPSTAQGEGDQADQQPASPRKSSAKPPEAGEHVAFGQFLLKPVNRRPWDAIGELECFNKEIQDTPGRKPSAAPGTEEPGALGDDGVKRSQAGEQTLHPPPTAAAPRPDRETASLPDAYGHKPSRGRPSSGTLAPATASDYREVRSAFFRPDANRPPPVPAPRKYDPVPLHAAPGEDYRLDIPVPQESLLRDVGLTVYTESSGRTGEPGQRCLSLPLPLEVQRQHGSSQPAPLAWDQKIALVKNNSADSLVVGSSRKGKAGEGTRDQAGLHVRGVRRENSRASKALSLPCGFGPNREMSRLGEDVDGRYALPEPLRWRNEATIADRHLETLLIHEKACSGPAEDLSNLYEVKCAKGIPENESIEQRAARILGIAVPVEALGVADQQTEGPPEGLEAPTGSSMLPRETDPHLERETQQVSSESEQVTGETVAVHGDESTEEEEEKEEEESEDQGESQPSSVLGLPEFPPSKLSLSLPVTPDQELALSVCGGEKKGPGGDPMPSEAPWENRPDCCGGSGPSGGGGVLRRKTYQHTEL
ncbi:junctional cadherin 5-associated protein [Aplochiton taeniatus]